MYPIFGRHFMKYKTGSCSHITLYRDHSPLSTIFEAACKFWKTFFAAAHVGQVLEKASKLLHVLQNEIFRCTSQKIYAFPMQHTKHCNFAMSVFAKFYFSAQ